MDYELYKTNKFFCIKENRFARGLSTHNALAQSLCNGGFNQALKLTLLTSLIISLSKHNLLLTITNMALVLVVL